MLIGLALANLVVMASLLALAASPLPASPAPPAPPRPTPSDACRAAAAEALAERGVPGTAALSADGALTLRLDGDDPAEAWTAFTAAMDLPARGCGPYDPIRVDVIDPSLAAGRRLVVEVRWADVLAWSQGRIDDDALSRRTSRFAYTQAPVP